MFKLEVLDRGEKILLMKTHFLNCYKAKDMETQGHLTPDMQLQ